jgi:hypothetical protein
MPRNDETVDTQMLAILEDMATSKKTVRQTLYRIMLTVNYRLSTEAMASAETAEREGLVKGLLELGLDEAVRRTDAYLAWKKAEREKAKFLS